MPANARFASDLVADRHARNLVLRRLPSIPVDTFVLAMLVTVAFAAVLRLEKTLGSGLPMALVLFPAARSG